MNRQLNELRNLTKKQQTCLPSGLYNSGAACSALQSPALNPTILQYSTAQHQPYALAAPHNRMPLVIWPARCRPQGHGLWHTQPRLIKREGRTGGAHTAAALEPRRTSMGFKIPKRCPVPFTAANSNFASSVKSKAIQAETEI